jgi:hypothetical protein
MVQPIALKSQETLTSLQKSRNPVTEVNEAKAPWREAALEGFRQRNAVRDSFFYDVGKVTPEEAQSIAPWFAKEGALLIVPPSGQGQLQLCTDVEQFATAGGTDVRILVVAGVGSSALGAAAFARNVADAFDVPVAALVSGYGISDTLTEAFGGFFWFGGLNKVRHQFEQIDDLLRGDAAGQREIQVSNTPLNVARTSLDTRVLVKLLSDTRFSFSLLAGHSKGNLVISEALFELDASTDANLKDTWIVTVSAAVAMPPRFKDRVLDVMGQWDWFGGLNSLPFLSVELRPPHAWHHTNTELAYHLPVTKVFQELKATKGLMQ